MFSRKRPRHVRADDAPPSTALAQSLAGDDDVAPEHGPYDVRHAPDGVPRLDLGSLQIPAIEGVEVRVQADQDGKIEQVVLVHGDSALQFGVFAAPRSEGIWDEVRDEMHQGDERGRDRRPGGRPASTAPSWWPGCPTRRASWSTSGSSASTARAGWSGPSSRGRWRSTRTRRRSWCECLEGLVVDRDDEPRPVREPLPLRLPQEMAEQAQGAPGEGE